MPMVSASSWIVWRQSSWMIFQIFSTFSVILLVPGRPERLSPYAETSLET
jgi:hypothetical protein